MEGINMKEVTKEVKMFNTRAICECGGEFEATGVELTTNPPQYPHRCDLCGDREVFDTIYPTMTTKEK